MREDRKRREALKEEERQRELEEEKIREAKEVGAVSLCDIMHYAVKDALLPLGGGTQTSEGGTGDKRTRRVPQAKGSFCCGRGRRGS